MWYIYNKILFFHEKRNKKEILPLPTTQVNPEVITLSEMISPICGIKKKILWKQKNGGFQKLEGGKTGRCRSRDTSPVVRSES